MKINSNIYVNSLQKKLLSREDFREAVFSRDGNKCVICHKKYPEILDAHHIIDRRLWTEPDQLGGYLLNNGSSLCPSCHLKAEMTTISVEEIRQACGITDAQKVLPEHLYSDQIYDKWSNPILANGTRLRGELFEDPSVQKILAEGNVLSLFSKYVKYPRTWHLSFSPGATKDDRLHKNNDHFKGKEVVVSLKLDGENTTMYDDYIHARSLADKKHWSKAWIKNFHNKIAHDIPENMRLVVENLYAKHSILYKNLESYAYGISIWQDLNCLSWDQSCEWFNLLGIPVVPVLYRGIWDEEKIKNLYKPQINNEDCEGFVVRLVDSFHYRDFSKSVNKFVRAGHVTSQDHWFHGRVGEINELKTIV